MKELKQLLIGICDAKTKVHKAISVDMVQGAIEEKINSLQSEIESLKKAASLQAAKSKRATSKAESKSFKEYRYDQIEPFIIKECGWESFVASLKNKFLGYIELSKERTELIEKNSHLKKSLASLTDYNQKADEECKGLKIENEKLKEQIEKLKSHYNCGAFKMSGRGHAEAACCETQGCPCEKREMRK